MVTASQSPSLLGISLTDYSRTAAQRGWGAGWPSCAGAQAAGTAIVTAERSGTRMSVHKRIARLVDMLIDETERRGYLLKPGQCGAYNCRAIGGTRSPSNHSWGLACDLNWNDNPMRKPLTTDIPKWMVQLWNRFGFAWGGAYSGTPDTMHLEFMGTPEQADALTTLAATELSAVTTGADVTLTPDQSRKLDEIHAALCTPTAPWLGGISDIPADSDALIAKAARYPAMGYHMRNNVEVYRTHQDVRTLTGRVNDLYALLSALANALHAPTP